MRALAFAFLVLVACDDESTASGGGGGSDPAGGAPAGGAPTGGAPGAGGAAGGDTPATPCEAYCGCMSETCSSFDGYPFATEGACLIECAGFTPEELSCFGGFCEQASTGTPTDHQCEHAWGELGTKEC